jgi:hypothetical protein
MTTKLTVTIEEDVIKSSKDYAQKEGRSLSELIENYLRTLSLKDKKKHDLSPKIKRLVGAISLPRNFDYKKELAKEINKKSGR